MVEGNFSVLLWSKTGILSLDSELDQAEQQRTMVTVFILAAHRQLRLCAPCGRILVLLATVLVRITRVDCRFIRLG